MKNKKKIISAVIAAALCAQSIVFVPFTASAAVTVPQEVTQNNVLEEDLEIVSDDASAAEATSISLGGAYTGSYQIKFDMTISGALHTDTADKGAANDTYLTIKGSKVGPYIISTGYNDEKSIQTFTWQAVNAEGSFDLLIGEKYTFNIAVENGSRSGGMATLEIKNSAGEVTFKQEGLSLRNYSDGNAKDGISTLDVINLKNEPKANITIGNLWVISATPDEIDVTLSQPVMGSTKNEVSTTSLTTDENVINIDPFEDSEISYAVAPKLNGAVTSAFETPIKVELKSEEPGFEFDKTNSKIITKKDLPAGSYDLVVNAQVSGYDKTKIECPVKLVKKEVTNEEIAAAFKSRINISPAASYIAWNPDKEAGQLQFSYDNIYEDISLPTVWGDYDVTWESSMPEVVSETGKIMPKADDTKVKLTAKADINGTAVEKKFDIVVKGAKAGAQAAIDKVVMLNSKLIKIDKANVNGDFTISAPQYNSTLAETETAGYRGDYIKLSFDEAKGIIEVDESGKATINPSENGNDDVVLNVTASYVKDGVEVEGASVTKAYNLKVTSSISSVIDSVLSGAIILNADTGKAADLDAVSYDITLPQSINGVTFKNWEISNDLFTISKDGKTARICGSEEGKETGTISADIIYKNYESTYKKNITGILSTDMADKYIVRCDAASSENFADVPSDGDTVSSSIDLPKKGVFGSDISWSSSVPKAISSTGKVSKQSSAKKVTLTAVISKGAAPSEIFTIKDLVVPSTSGSTSGGGGGGGSSSSRPTTNSTVSSTGNRNSDVSYKGTLTPTTSLEKGDITTAQVSSFSDLSAAAWAREAVTALYNKGIINGKSASTFAPNDDITRAEFAKIVVKAFGLEDTSANVSNFSDVKAGDWYYTAVASAYNKGIIKGYADGRFGVSDKITRQDMAVIIYRAAQAAGKTIAPVKDGVTFDDNAEIASYAAEAVSTLQKGGVINGMTATTFAPSATATRAQAAQMIYGIVK